MYIYVIAVSIFALIQQIKTEKNVTFVPSSHFYVNSCGQNFPKITVKKLHVFKNYSLEICNFIKNGVRSG